MLRSSQRYLQLIIYDSLQRIGHLFSYKHSSSRVQVEHLEAEARAQGAEIADNNEASLTPLTDVAIAFVKIYLKSAREIFNHCVGSEIYLTPLQELHQYLYLVFLDLQIDGRKLDPAYALSLALDMERGMHSAAHFMEGGITWKKVAFVLVFVLANFSQNKQLFTRKLVAHGNSWCLV